MGALAQLTDEQLSTYRDLLAAKQGAAQGPPPPKPPLPAGLQPGANFVERMTNQPHPESPAERFTMSREPLEGLTDIAGGHPFKGAGRIATPFLMQAGPEAADIGPAALRRGAEAFRAGARTAKMTQPAPYLSAEGAAAHFIPAPVGATRYLLSKGAGFARGALTNLRQEPFGPEITQGQRVMNRLNQEPPPPNPLRASMQQARLAREGSSPSAPPPPTFDIIRSPLPSGRVPGTGTPRITVDTSAAPKPSPDAILDDLSRSLAGKPFAKLNPAQQQTVRTVAGRVTSAPTETIPSPVAKRGPQLVTPAEQLKDMMVPGHGTRPGEVATIPSREPVATSEAYAGGARMARQDKADVLAEEFKGGLDINSAEDWQKALAKHQIDFPKTALAKQKLIRDVRSRLGQ